MKSVGYVHNLIRKSYLEEGGKKKKKMVSDLNV
jgi:hypothetical protein